MKKITDKERLDWLTKTGNLVEPEWTGNEKPKLWVIRTLDSKEIWRKTPRAAIDNAIRAAIREGK